MCSAITYTPMTKVMLSGSLAKRFFRSKPFLLDGGSAVEVFRALNATNDGFADEIKRLERLGLKFPIFRSRVNIGMDGFDLGGTREIRIVPVIDGSKRAGGLQTIIGTVMIAAAYVLSFTPFAAASPFLYAAGASMAIGGIIQILSPQASGLKQSAMERDDGFGLGSG